MPRAVLIVNPNASRVTPDLTLAVEEALQAGGEVETILSERPLHAREIAEAAGRDAERIYVYSGDGGFNEVVNGLEADVAVAFIPGGSTSVFPRALGVPRDPVRAARALAGSSSERRISLGRVNGRRFTFSAGVGVDAELVRRVDALGRATGKRASDLAFARTLAGIFAGSRARFEPVMEVEGLGDYLPKYAGNLDIMTAAAARTAEMFAEEILAGRLSLSPAGSAAALATA